MLGAIIGDIVGSRFEWDNIKTKDFELFTDDCFVTDDSVMTLAIAKAIMESDSSFEDLGKKAVIYMQKLGRKYPYCSYGGSFAGWLVSSNPKPYNSWGNGAAMRVSAVAYVGNSLKEVIDLSKKVTEVTHNHPEGIKGAEATAVAIYLARTGSSLEEIKDYIDEHYYGMNFKLDEIREGYQFDESCQGTVPQSLAAFFESTSFEDAIRNAISLGGDSDTLAAITGSVAEAYYGIPPKVREVAIRYLDRYLRNILFEFETKYINEGKNK
ncbi:MAG: ADP-ribosylglycohydrolase family protein [Erysipelotrichaceae bacterium]|jgi:ADP-ribosylglycohydrolase